MKPIGHLFILNDPIDPHVTLVSSDNIIFCGTTAMTIYQSDLKEFHFYDQISQLHKQAYLIIFGFLILLLISMLSIQERFQSRRIYIQ